MSHRSRASARRWSVDESADAVVAPWGVELVASVLCKRWKPGIIWLLQTRPLRFGQMLQALPGVSAKMLTAQLRELEKDGLVERVTDRAVARRTYQLTVVGAGLGRLIAAWDEWAVEYVNSRPGSLARYGLLQLFEHATDDISAVARVEHQRAD